MQYPKSTLVLTAAALLGTVGLGMAHPHPAKVQNLQRENAVLKESLIASNLAEESSAQALSDIRLRLEALGKNLFDGGDERLLQAVKDLEVMNRRVRKLEEASLRLSSSVQAYLKTAVASDPESRVALESRLRDLEALVGLRTRPQRKVDLGNLQHSKVVSIDEASGLIVVNTGEKAGARIGMMFQIKRGDTVIGDAVVALAEKDVAGLLIQSTIDQNNPVRLHDVAALKVD